MGASRERAYKEGFAEGSTNKAFNGYWQGYTACETKYQKLVEACKLLLDNDGEIGVIVLGLQSMRQALKEVQDDNATGSE